MMNNLLTLALSFGKIGLISLGGGNSMLKLIEYETVMAQHWLTHQEFGNMLGSSFLFPGLTALKLAALIGYKAAGIFGLIVATLALNLPGIILATVGYTWLSGQDSPYAHKLMIIVQYGALTLLTAAVVSIAQDIFILKPSIILTGMSVLFLFALTFFNLSPFWGFLVFIGLGFMLG